MKKKNEYAINLTILYPYIYLHNLYMKYNNDTSEIKKGWVEGVIYFSVMPIALVT